MIRALIFDLDNCLAAANEVGEALYQPAFDAIRALNQGRLSEDALQAAFSDVWRHPLDWVSEQHGFSAAMRKAGWEAFSEMTVQSPMAGYDDLPALAELKAEKFLVTSGFRRLQASKIEALGLENLFTAIYIDAIDEEDRFGKQGLFEQILEQTHLAPANLLVVGDNADSEIAAGNRMGIRTVQTLREGVPPSDHATYQIRSLYELKKLIENPADLR